MDEQGVIARSNAGQAYVRRLRELGQQVETELRPQQTALQTEVTALERLPADQRATRQQALQTRANTFQTLASTRQRELQATQEQQLRRIASEMQPVVAQVYAQRGCGLMLDASAVVYANPAMNVTDAVLAGLNTRLPTLTFNRASAPAAPAATAPATRR
jgi:outer membrane protein